MAENINVSLSNSTNLPEYGASVYVMISFEIILIPIIVGGNGLVITAVWRFKTLQNPSNVMVAFLSFGDFLMGAVYIPTKLLSSPANFSKIPCLVNVFNSYVCIALAMTFLSLLSIERFYAIQFPFHYLSHVTIKKSIICCGVIFAGIVALMMPIISGIDTWAYGKYCFNTNILPRYYIWTVLSIMGLVLFAGFLSFVRVVLAEIKVRKRKSEFQFQSDIRQMDTVKSLLMIIVYSFSLMCWMPQIVYVFWSAFNPTVSSIVTLKALSVLGLCSSGSNFFIYGIKNSRFRQSFKQLLRCRVSAVDPLTSLPSGTC